MIRLLISVLLITLLSGCLAMLPQNHNWGEDVTLRPGWQRLGTSVARAAKSPGTWMPMVGTLIFQVDDWDEDLSDWASRVTPIFGSMEDADKWSTNLANTSQNAYYLTSLVLPSGEKPVDWTLNKLKGLAVGFSAAESVSLTTDIIKEETDRQRPNRANRRSFPSGHTSRATSYATLTARNIDLFQIEKRNKIIAKSGIYSLAVATAWARVEAKMHYPSDVLAGAALAHFISLFIHNSFIGLDQNFITPQIEIGRDTKYLGFSWRY